MKKQRRSLYIFYGVSLLVFLNYGVAQAITPIYILYAGGSEFHSGLQGTLFFLTAVILRFYFGPLADRKGNKLTLTIGAIVFATAPVLYLCSEQLWYIMLIRTYQAIGLAAYFSSASSLVSALAPADKLGKYMGYHRLVNTAPFMVGPALALVLIDAYGYREYHIAGVIVGTLALILLYYVKEPRGGLQGHEDEKPASINMLKLLKGKRLSSIYLSIFVICLFQALLLTFTIIYIGEFAQGINPGIFFTLYGLGSICSSYIAGTLSDRKGSAVVAFSGMLLFGFGLTIFYFIPACGFIIYPASFITGAGFAAAIVALISLIIKTVSPTLRTTALALQDNAFDTGMAAGSILFGTVIPVVGMPWSHGMAGLVVVLFTLWRILHLTSGNKGSFY